MEYYKRGIAFEGGVNILPTQTFEETVLLLGQALGITFMEDQEGKYEEYPAYRAFALGLEIALLAPPLPELDTREVPDNVFQLIVRGMSFLGNEGVCVDMNALLESQIISRTNLKLASHE